MSDRDRHWVSYISWPSVASAGLGLFLWFRAQHEVKTIEKYAKYAIIEGMDDLRSLIQVLPALIALRGRVNSLVSKPCELSTKSAVIHEIVEEEVWRKESITPSPGSGSSSASSSDSSGSTATAPAGNSTTPAAGTAAAATSSGGSRTQAAASPARTSVTTETQVIRRESSTCDWFLEDGQSLLRVAVQSPSKARREGPVLQEQQVMVTEPPGTQPVKTAPDGTWTKTKIGIRSTERFLPTGSVVTVQGR